MSDAPLQQAINAPSGHLTQALLSHISAQNPKVGEGIFCEIQKIIEQLHCDSRGRKNWLVSAILASHLSFIFLIDPEWSQCFIIDYMLFEDYPNEANMLWRCYLYHPTYSADLVQQLFPALISAVKNRSRLLANDDKSHLRDKVVEFYIISQLHFPEIFSGHNTQEMISKFNVDELECATFSAYRFLSANKNEDDAWQSKLKGWLSGKIFLKCEVSAQRGLQSILLKYYSCLMNIFAMHLIFWTSICQR